MTRALLLLAGILTASNVGVARAPATSRDDARVAVMPAADTAVTTKFEVAGISVILRRNPANEVVVANLYLLGGARQLTPETAGIEAMLLAASERGTRKFPGSALRQRTARLGSAISIEAGDDWTAIGLHAIRATFDSTWALMADRVIAPTLAPSEVELVRDLMLTGARERRSDPDDAATELADSRIAKVGLESKGDVRPRQRG